jgi:hypothetical protein
MNKLIIVLIILMTWLTGISQDFPPPGPIYINIDNDSVYLSWQSPGSKFLSHYSIYFNSCWEDGVSLPIGTTTDTTYTLAIPVFHYKMNFGVSAEYLDPVGQSDTVWINCVIPGLLDPPLNIDFEDPPIYGINMASCILVGNDNWELIDSIYYSPEHCAAFFSFSVGSKSLLHTMPVMVDEDDVPIISFKVRIPEKNQESDTLRLLHGGEPFGNTLYSINDWQYFIYFEGLGVGNCSPFEFEAIAGGGGGIFIDDIMFETCTNMRNSFDNDIHLNIFPNPATSFITIHIKEGIAIEEAIIYNHLGQKALVAVPVNNTVDVSGLRPGIYFLEVVTSENRTGTKLVVE